MPPIISFEMLFYFFLKTICLRFSWNVFFTNSFYSWANFFSVALYTWLRLHCTKLILQLPCWDWWWWLEEAVVAVWWVLLVLVAPSNENVSVVVVLAKLWSTLFVISALLKNYYSVVSFTFCGLKTDHSLLPYEPLL